MKKYILLGILTGLLLGVSWPTYGYPLFLFIAFVPLLYVENDIREKNLKKSNLKVYLISFIAFFIWNSITTWWLYYATALGMSVAILLNSLLMSFIILIYHVIAKRIPQKTAYIFLITLWISYEKFILNWDLSWPWLNLGNGFAMRPKWIQWYEYTGIFGGTLWVWIVNIILVAGLIKFIRTKNKTFLIRHSILGFSIVVILLFSSLLIYHNYKEKGTKLTAIVLQPNVDPYSEKYNQNNLTSVQHLIELAQTKMDSSVTLIVAPETTLATPTNLNSYHSKPSFKYLKRYTEKYKNLDFLTGISFYKPYHSTKKPTGTANYYNRGRFWYDSYNSALFISSNFSAQIYDKSKLVAGVEMMPYKKYLSPIIGDFMINLGGSTASLATQKKRTVFKTYNSKFGFAPVICYESVYGQYVTNYIKNGANIITIITNDGWWDDSQGYKQHLSFATLRAIENRRSVARSANTGISCFINQRGDLLASLPYGTKGALKQVIRANKKLTFYTKYGDYIARLSQFIMVIILLITIAKSLKKESH